MNDEHTERKLDAHDWPKMPDRVRKSLDTLIADEPLTLPARSLSIRRSALLAASVGLAGFIAGYTMRDSMQPTREEPAITQTTSTPSPVVLRIDAQPIGASALGAAAARPSLTR